MRSLAAVYFFLSLIASRPVEAAAPTLDALNPAGTKASTETVVTIIGKFEPWPPEIWCSEPKIQFKADPEKKGQFTVTVPESLTPGPALVRIHNPEGVSEPRIFVVSGNPEIMEDTKVDNDSLAEPTPVESLPVVINGRLEKSQDVDAWRFPLKKGQTLVAHLDGYALRSGIDPFLHLYGPDGKRIVLANDNAVNLDPHLETKIEKDGDYTVAIMAIASPPNANVTFHGAAGAVYRLTLSTDPAAAPSSIDPDFPAKDTPIAEKPLPIPIEVAGTLSKKGETDKVRFTGTKGQKFLVKVRAFQHGFPTDPVLDLFRPDGTLLRRTDDTKPDRDAEYPLSIPADGEYAAAVSDRFGRGGPEFRYRLIINESIPDYTVTADKSNYLLEPGKTAELKLKLTRLNGHVAPLKVESDGLPKGVSLEVPDIPEKSGDIAVKFKVDEKAAPFSGPITVQLLEAEGEKPQKRTAAFSFQDSTSRGPYLIQETTDLWLLVKPAKKDDADAKKADEKKSP